MKILISFYLIFIPVFIKAADAYRLPSDTVFPVNYKLELTLDDDVFVTNVFSGILDLTIKTFGESQEIKLHANKLTISNVTLTLNEDDIPLENPEGFESDPVTDILTLTTSTPLAINTSYILHFVFTGELRTNEMYGFYKSSYVDANGESKYLATTQFQTTYARRAFPCFDEPSFKATFDISIKHPSIYVVTSNMKGTPDTTGNEPLTTTTFGQTPKMSTYLIAFIVSDFTCTEGDAADGDIPYQVCSRDEAASTRQVAVDAGPKLLKALEDFTGIKYEFSGIDKYDQFAIPDFAAGAMENWGLTTYRETGLLWDPTESSNLYKQRAEAVIAHELAHFWFGDLVTTHWWSDTFLNEGFARYFQYFLTAEIETDWELDKQFVVEQLQAVLQNDALGSAAALSHEASSPSEVSARFGTISYSKGASILRMIEHVMGLDNFKSGIQDYLTEHVFDNTIPTDLWNALQTYISGLPTGLSLETVIENWILKPGFPVLEVKSDGLNVTISQKKFLVSGTPNDNEKWYVPISYTKSTDSDKFENTSVKAWLLINEDLTIQNALTDAEWFILNNQQTGYYRVDYDQSLWNKISSALNKPDFDGIHVLNRAQLVDDFYNLAKVGTHTFSEVLNFFLFLKEDTSYFSWYSAFAAFSNMLERTGDEKIRTFLSTYILELMDALYNSVSLTESNDDNQIGTLNRVAALSWACRLGRAECTEHSTQSFNLYKLDQQTPDKNLKSVIYCNALRNSENIQEDFDFLWMKYGNTKLSTEQVTILTALGCARDQAVITDYLQKSINATSGIRQQDALSVFSAVYSGNPEGVDIAFNFLIENYLHISSYYGSMNSISTLISGLAGRFTKTEQTDKLRNFIDSTTDLTEALEASARAALANAEENLQWTERFERELETYFAEKESGSANAMKVGLTIVMTTALMLCHQLL